VLFWVTTIIRYLFTACASLVISVAVSFLILVPFARDASPGLGFLSFTVFIAVATLLIPLSLGATAELIQHKVLSRRFQWSNALMRTLACVPIAIGPVYAATTIFPYAESHRPAHWVAKEILFYCLSVVFACFALRIRRPSAGW
jgi:hypothetical protein